MPFRRSEIGIRWGIYDCCRHGYKVAPYRGTRNIVAIAFGVKHGLSLAKALNKGREREDANGG